VRKLVSFPLWSLLLVVLLALALIQLPSVKAAPPQPFWSLTGNSGTNPAVNFLGTTDTKDLVLRTNNLQQLRISSIGTVLIGRATDVFCGGALVVTGCTPLNVGGGGDVTSGDHELINAGSTFSIGGEPSHAGLSIGYRADGTGAVGGIVRSTNALPMMLGTTNGPMSVVIRDPTGADSANSGKGNVGIGVGETPASRLHVSTDSLISNETGITVEIPGVGVRRIVVGDADSAGPGFRALKVAN